jgi:hypothetical protein
MARLEAAAAALPAGRRTDLTAEVREHIDTALAAAGNSDEVTVRNVLERLGTPEEIVAGEVANLPASGTGTDAGSMRRSWGLVEVLALLSIGLAWPALVYFRAPNGPLLWFGLGIVGLVLVWFSKVWTTRWKVIATAIVVAAYVLFFAFTTPVTVTCTTGNPPVACPAGGPQPVETSIP